MEVNVKFTVSELETVIAALDALKYTIGVASGPRTNIRAAMLEVEKLEASILRQIDAVIAKSVN